MKAIDAIKFVLGTSENVVMMLIDDMKDAPLTFPTAKGGSHPLWVLGHLTLVEGAVREILLGEPNPVAQWQAIFGGGTEPVDDAGKYPPFEEVRAKFNELRAANMKLLDSLSEDDLDKPTKNPPKGLEQVFDTFGNSWLTIAEHMMAHRGSVADARRAVGRKPMMMWQGVRGGLISIEPVGGRSRSLWSIMHSGFVASFS